ncbi:hypothetical protein Syun_009601 [Stephania yunnanensis]|uniref:Uncharacterized protein n=1 Tax=Stephania yunnanensis TaxID=152371 RepID=A0AAP0KHB3_9MAGN
MLPLSPDSLSLRKPYLPKNTSLLTADITALCLTALSITALSHGSSTALSLSHRSLSPESHSPSTFSFSPRSVVAAIEAATRSTVAVCRVCRREVSDGTKDSPCGPWEFVGLLPLFHPPRHDSTETITKDLDLGVSVKMISCDQLAIAKETGRRLGMGANMYPSTSLLGEHKDGSISTLPIDELIEKADGFAGVFPSWYSHNFGLDGQDQVNNDGSECVMPVQQHNYQDLEMEYEASKVAFDSDTTTGTLSHNVSDGISFFLVCLIGRSLGLIYKGIRQSLGGQLILLGKGSDGRVQRDFEGLANLFHYQVDKFSFPILLLSPLHFLFYNVKRLLVE